MRALWMEDGRLTLVDAPLPDRQDECLIKVTLSGICGTDLHMRRGYADFTGIPGHEFVGVVERTTSAAHRHWIGQRGVGDMNIGGGGGAPPGRGAGGRPATSLDWLSPAP